jgi:TonB family protein
MQEDSPAHPVGPEPIRSVIQAAAADAQGESVHSAETHAAGVSGVPLQEKPHAALPASHAESVATTPSSALEPAVPRSPYVPRMPRSPSGMLVAGAALLVVAGVFAASLHRTPTEQPTTQPLAGGPTANSPETTTRPMSSTPSPAPDLTAPAQVATATPAAVVRVRRAPVDEDEDADERGVAPPYRTPIPGQPMANTQPLPKPSAAEPISPPPVVRQSRPPSDEVASTASVPQQPGAAYAGHGVPAQSYAGGQPGYRPELHASYRDPDAAIVGDLPRSGRGSRAVLSDHPNYLEISSGMMAANLISAPMPDYPMLAKVAHIGGEVILQAVISKNGTVSATRVMSGHRLLRGAAQDAVRRWRYRPYVMDGHPVEVATVVTVRFHPKQ